MNNIILSKYLCRQSLFKKVTSTYVTRHPMKFVEAEDRWKKMDNVSRGWELIYKAPMEKAMKFFSGYLTLTTATVGCSGLYYAGFVFDKTKMNDPVLLGEDVIIANSSMEYMVYVGAFIAFHLAMKVLISKYVIRMYQKGDNYIAIFRGHTFTSTKKHNFHLDEFHKLSPIILISWNESRFSLGKRNGIILENHFKTPEYLSYLINKRQRPNPNEDY